LNFYNLSVEDSSSVSLGVFPNFDSLFDLLGVDLSDSFTFRDAFLLEDLLEPVLVFFSVRED